MLAFLIAVGVIGTPVEPPAGVGEIIATADTTVTAAARPGLSPIGPSIPLGAPEWPRAFDPGDLAPYAHSFDNVLAAGERIAEIVSVRMPPQAAALGVQIEQDPAYLPIIDADGGRAVQLYFSVDPAMQEAAQFDAAGVKLPVSFRVLTDANPPNRYERSAVLPVRQL